jgi:hypothetical protein
MIAPDPAPAALRASWSPVGVFPDALVGGDSRTIDRVFFSFFVAFDPPAIR